MKPPKRKLTPLLISQIKTQEIRIKQCGLQAYASYNMPLDEGSYRSKRLTKIIW